MYRLMNVYENAAVTASNASHLFGFPVAVRMFSSPKIDQPDTKRLAWFQPAD